MKCPLHDFCNFQPPIHRDPITHILPTPATRRNLEILLLAFLITQNFSFVLLRTWETIVIEVIGN